MRDIAIADQKSEPLTWEQRVNIAQDISRGLEYLHEGVSMACLPFPENLPFCVYITCSHVASGGIDVYSISGAIC